MTPAIATLMAVILSFLVGMLTMAGIVIYIEEKKLGRITVLSDGVSIPSDKEIKRLREKYDTFNKGFIE